MHSRTKEILPGALLLSMGILAMILSNSPFGPMYFKIVNSKSPVNVLFFVNKILMTIFFLDVGFEIKQQVIRGHLSQSRQIMLPVIAAIGGVIVPAIIFLGFNLNDPIALQGWAIPTATDIAFALGIIILLGKSIPIGLRVLLLSIAIVDDLIAILIIALFYTSNITFAPILFSLGIVLLLMYLNMRSVHNIIHYLMLGTILWYAMYLSGIHPTLSGVIIALTTPLRARENIHKQLYFWVSFVILPIFALTNAGISLQDIHISQILHPLPLGIACGLLFGKQIGVFSFAWLGVNIKLAILPDKVNWKHIYGMSLVCGIGFTMSIFIGNLAFSDAPQEYIVLNKLGVLTGSIASALLGFAVLYYVPRNKIRAKL